MLSKKTKLCVKVLVAIASAPPGEPVTTLMLSKTLHVSVSHLESIARALREAGLVRASRGPGGGYYLTRDTDSLSVWEVVQLVDDTLGRPANTPSKTSPIASLEAAISATFVGFLSERTVGEFARTDLWASSSSAPAPSGFRLRPLPQAPRPTGPRSVFELSFFPRLSAA
jgi:Rrf2 family protein